MSGQTDPKSLRADIDKCLQQCDDTRQLFTTFQDSITQIVNNSKFIQQLNIVYDQLAKIEDNQKNFLTIGKYLKDNEEFFLSLKPELDESKAKIRKLHKKEKELSADQEILKTQISDHNTNLISIKSFIDDENTRQNQLKNIIIDEAKKESQDYTNSEFRRLNTKIDTEQQVKLDQLDNSHKAQLQGLTESFQNFVDQTNNSINNITIDHENAVKRIDALDESLGKTNDTVEAINNKQILDSGRIDDLSNNFNDMNEKINDINDKINDIYDKIRLIEANIQINKQESEQEDQNLHDEINNLKQRDNDQDLENQNAFNEIRDEINNLKNKDDEIDQRLTDEVNNLNNQIQQLDEKAADNLKQQADRLDERIDESNNNFDQFVEQDRITIENIHKREDEIEQNHEDLKESLDQKEANLSNAFTELSERFNNVKEYLSEKVRFCSNRNEEVYRKIITLQGDDKSRWKDVTMTDFGDILDNIKSKVDDTSNELKNNLDFAKEKMMKDIQIANEKTIKSVESLQNQLDNQKESIQQVLSEQIQNASEQFHQIMNEMNVDSIQTRQLLCQFFEVDSKVLSLALSQPAAAESSEDSDKGDDQNKEKKFSFITSLPVLLQKIDSVDERSQDSAKRLNEELNDLTNNILEELESYDILKSDVEKKRNDIETFKNMITTKVDEITSKTEEVKINEENINKDLLLIENKIEQANNRMDRSDDQLKNDLDNIRNQIELNDNSIKSIVNSKFETFNTSYKETIQELQQNTQDIHDRIDGMFGSSGMTFDKFVEEIRNVREETTRFFNSEEKTNQKIDQIKSDVDAYAQNASEINEQTINELNEVKSQLQSTIDNNAKTADEQLRAAQNDLQRAIESVDKKIFDFIGSDNPKLKISDIFARIKEVDENSKNADIQLSNRIDELEKNATENFSKIATTCLKLNKNVEIRKSEIENLQKQTKNNFIEFDNRINSEKVQILNQVKQNQEETLYKLNEISNTFSDVRKSIANVSNKSQNLVTNLENKFNDILEKSRENILSSVESYFKPIDDNFNEIRKTISMIQGKDGNDIPSLIKKISAFETSFQSQIDGIQEHHNQIRQDINDTINNTKTSINERIDQLILDSNSKVENMIKTAETQNNQNLQKIDKMNLNITTKLKQLDEKIINLDGDSGINLKTLYDAFNELNLSVHTEFTKAATEINKVKKKQERQPEELKEELTNDFKSIINSNKSENDQIFLKMNEILEIQKEYATLKAFQELEKKVTDLEENQINEIIKSQEQITNEMTEYSLNLSKEVKNRLEKHQKKLTALKESVTRINGDAEISLGQCIEKISNIEKDLSIAKTQVTEIQKVATEEIRKAEDHFIIDFNSMNVQLEEMKQQMSTDNKKITEDVKENSRILEEHKLQTETYIKTLESNTKEQIAQYGQQISDKYSSFTAQINNKINKFDNDINITKSSFEKVNKNQIAFSRSTKDSLDSLRTYVDSQFDLSSKALQNLHIEMSNEVSKLLNENSTVFKNISKEVNERASQSISELRADFEKLRCGSKLSIPMIVDQIKSVSDFINSKEKENENKIKSFDDKINKVEQNSLTKTKQKSSKLKSVIKSLQEQTTNNKNQLDEAILNSQGSLREEMKSLEKRLTNSINGNKESVDDSIKKINENQKLSQTKADNQFSKIDVQFNDVDSRFLSLQEEEKNHFAEFFRKTLDKINDKNAKNLEQVNKSIQKVRLDVQEKLDEMSDLANKLQISFSDVQTKNDQISLQNRELSAMSKTDLAAILDQFKDSVQNKLNIMKKRVQEIDDSLEEVKSETRISFQTAESKIDTTNTKMDEMKNSVSKQLKSAVEEVDASVKKVNDDYSVLIQNNDNQFKKFKEEVTLLIENTKIDLIKDTTQRNNVISAEFITIKTDLKSKTEGLEKDVNDLQEDLRTNIHPSIKKINARIDELTEELKESDQTTTKSITEIFAKFEDSYKLINNFEKTINDSENRMTEFTRTLKLDFIAARKDIDSISNNAVHDISEMKASVDAISRDVLDLKRIKHLNANYEDMNMRFEDALAGLHQFQKSIFNIAFPIHQNSVAVNGRPFNNTNTSPDKNMQELMKKGPLIPSKKDRFYIKGKKKNNMSNKSDDNELCVIDKDTEIGEILREAFKTHNYVVLIVPEKKKVYWNRGVNLLPNQVLEIQGERMSLIQMEGISDIGGMYDLSRVVIDGFGYLKLKNVKIQAQCNIPLPLYSSRTANSSNDEKYLSCLDLGALFVSRCWDASGPGSIVIDSCSFETDVPIVNIGANSFCHVKICESGLTTRAKVNSNENEEDDNNIVYPVTCDNGGYGQGYGSISIRNVNIASPKIKWLNSPFLIQPDISND